MWKKTYRSEWGAITPASNDVQNEEFPPIDIGDWAGSVWKREQENGTCVDSYTSTQHAVFS